MTQFFDRWWCDFCPLWSGVAPDDPFAQTENLPIRRRSNCTDLSSCQYWKLQVINNARCSVFSTSVRNTVVRAILQAYGKWWISTPWGAETAEPIEMKLGMGDYVGDPTYRHKTKSVRKGGSFGGGGEMFNPSVLFFFSFYWFPERTSSLPGKDWLSALCTQKRVLVVSWFLGVKFPPKSNVPILCGKNPFFNAKE